VPLSGEFWLGVSAPHLNLSLLIRLPCGFGICVINNVVELFCLQIRLKKGAGDDEEINNLNMELSSFLEWMR